ncbi:MAG: PaaI family thioesterase [Chloroflexi bacterium]|nr:PaaI family thioesterase [Chloroflexota bacterium]
MQKLPSSSSCYVCGRENPISLKLEFYVNDDGNVVSEFCLEENYAGYPGMVHGGNIAAILDEIAGRALTTDDPNRFMVTSQLRVKYFKPVPTNMPLLAIGKAVKKRGRTAVGASEIRTKGGVVLASCEAFFVEVQDEFSNQDSLEESGWKVYPDD